jgi:ATP/ADP translocase
MGRLFGVVNFINIFLQFFGCAILLKILGLRKTHLLIPSILLIQVGLFLVHPTFALICMAFGTIKSFDYSIFGIVKEMLYIPLNVSQKFQAKAIIDVFAYRSSKALGSFLILTLTYFSPKNITSLITASVICIFLLWMGAVISMREYFANLDEENPLKIK